MVFCKISGKIIEKKVLENDRCSDYTFLKVENEKGKNFNFYADVSNGNCMGVFVEENDILFGEKQKFIVNYLNNSVLNIFDDNLDEKNIYSGIRDVNILDLQECKFENGLLNYFYFFIIFFIFDNFYFMLQEKNFCKIHGKITKRELNGKYFPNNLTTKIKFRLEKDGKNFDFFADVNSGNCEGCYIMFDSFKLGTEKFFIINKNNFDVESVGDTEYSQIIHWDEENFLDFEKIEECKSGAENIVYEVGDIDEKLFENKNLEQEILQEKTIISEKNFLEKIDFFYVIMFFIFLISIIFTVYSIKKK